MKKGIQGENIAITILVIVIIVTLMFSIITIYTSNSSLTSNEMTDVSNTTINQKDFKNNGENQTPSTPKENNENIIKDDNIQTEKTEEVKFEPKQIATYTTTIYDSDQNRVDNISLANSKLNQKIIKPGEEFSFNNTIGPMDESQGFKKALGFDSQGNKIQISGGGICQISSTLYNAALIANLNVTERHPHSHRVNYVPKDKDATIFYGTYDLKFINTTDRDIRIETSNDNANVTINLVQI